MQIPMEKSGYNELSHNNQVSSADGNPSLYSMFS